MTEALEFAKRLESISLELIYSISGKIIAQDLDKFEKFNRDQMEAGRRPDQTLIDPKYRSTVYAATKTQKHGRPALTPNLRDTGDFHRSVAAEYFSQKILLDATDQKTDKLKDKYGKVLGISFEDQNKYLQETEQKIINALWAYLNKY